jgi:tRNA (adenine57-N1/adenine58-N1)-methyltransferase
MVSSSTFLSHGPVADGDSLAVLHLRRDLQIPVVLRSADDQNEGYSEGKVTNTRFGSFPHSTLIGVPWGSQVRASAVDTGSRGRKSKKAHAVDPPTSPGQKRKRLSEAAVVGFEDERNGEDNNSPKVAVAASTGFAHLLPPTPESWTTSLPHRTQVVYTPDYSYILQHLRVRPGSVIIEAGAGSGSFTHAAARAVFNGYPTLKANMQTERDEARQRIHRGKVWSFEFHEQRFQKIQTEIRDHGLDEIVETTHRDVCADGFSVFRDSFQAVQADAVFLDLPAPWLALKHLTRAATNSNETAGLAYAQSLPNSSVISPLCPHHPVRICTFSPCIEQVQRTITMLRSLSYTSIETVELSAKRIEVRRERVGLAEEGQRGVNASPATVDEAITRLREIEGRTKEFHSTSEITALEAKKQTMEKDKVAPESRKLFKEGRLMHRAEPELKTHTSYLVFAVLPRQWNSEDEARAHVEWVNARVEEGSRAKGMSRRQMKREKKTAEGGNKGEVEVDGESVDL